MKLKAVLKKIGMSQEALAEHAGVSQGMIGHVLNKRKKISLKLAVAIAEAVKKPIDEIFDHEDISDYNLINKIKIFSNPLMIKENRTHYGCNEYILTTDHCAPHFPKNATVVVDKEKPWRESDFVLLKLQNNGYAVGQYSFNFGEETIVFENSKYPPVRYDPLTKNPEIIGVILSVTIAFKKED